MTEVATKPEKVNILDDVKVERPDNAIEKTRKYFCGINREGKGAQFAAFDFQIRVGPVCFATQTFKWEGKGETAQQRFRNGAVYALSDRQVDEVKAKLKWRYLRARTVEGRIVGVEDVDSSDGGGSIKPDDHSGNFQPARYVPGRLRGDETPLKDILVFEPCIEDDRLGGTVVTLDQLKAMVAEAEADEARLEAGGPDEFEAKKAAPNGPTARDPKALQRLSTTDGKRKAEAGLLPG